MVILLNIFSSIITVSFIADLILMALPYQLLFKVCAFSNPGSFSASTAKMSPVAACTNQIELTGVSFVLVFS